MRTLRVRNLDIDEEGYWFTSNGAHIHANRNGWPDAGPRNLVRYYRKPMSSRHIGGGSGSASETEGIRSKEPPKDSYGRSYSKPQYWLHPEEYKKVIEEIDRDYHVVFAGLEMASIITNPSVNHPAHVYLFEIHGFNEYNIYSKYPHVDGSDDDDER